MLIDAASNLFHLNEYDGVEVSKSVLLLVYTKLPCVAR